jgi:hypothetical protein
MSSLPHEEGVAEVIALLVSVEALDTEAEKLRPMVDRLEEVEKLRVSERHRLAKLLRSMDVESPGNFGWERRSVPCPSPPRRMNRAITATTALVLPGR